MLWDMLRVEVKDYCPALKRLGIGPVIEFNPARMTRDGIPCVTGGGYPTATVLGDRMVQVVGDVEVACDGCALLVGGFREVVKKKIA